MNDSLHAPAVTPALWPLRPEIHFLNHGSFGSCPRQILESQTAWRLRLESQPIQFFVRDLEGLLDQAREKLAAFLGAAADNLVFVTNATTGVNSVLRSLEFPPGDELLVTNHEYNACRNALDYVAAKGGARVVVANLPFPFAKKRDLIAPILEAVTARTRLALLDHVTSQTAVVLPLEEIIPALNERGVETLIDGAHAPGMIPLRLEKLAPTYYTGNCHKWICAPKGAGFLYVQKEKQPKVRPTVISHGANSPRRDRSKFLIEFGWVGTSDVTSWLCVPEAIEFMSRLLPGGWPAIMERNRQLALAARQKLCAALPSEPACPDEFLGAMASLRLPPAANAEPSKSPLYLDPLQEILLQRFHVETPIIPWPHPPHRLLRVSAQLYNHLGQYEKLAAALQELSSHQIR